MKKRLFCSFSGGRTSAVMTKWCLDNLSDEYEIIVGFSNTGEEHEKTLIFADLCDRYFGFNTVWLEAVVHANARCAPTHRIVSFETASRHGEPFEEVIKKYGIPNMSWPHCTRDLKLSPIKSYLRSIGWDDYATAIGIRTDEARRVRKDAETAKIIYPLSDLHPMDKQDVNDWWHEQSFNLELMEHQGNCKWCWKKALSKHMRLISEVPEIYDFPRRMESQYGFSGTNPNGEVRVFFRGNRSTDDLFKLAKELDVSAASQRGLFDLDANGGCAESCELYPLETTA